MPNCLNFDDKKIVMTMGENNLFTQHIILAQKLQGTLQTVPNFYKRN